MDGMSLEHVSKFKYLGCVLDESGTDEAECHRKVASRRRVAVAIRSLVNVRGLHLKCDRVLHETLLLPVLRMVVRKGYGRRTRELGLRLYRWTTLEVC